MPDEPNEVKLEVSLPEVEAGGTYANLVAVWHSTDEFTLDFIAMGMSRVEGSTTVIPGVVTSRVRVPVSVIFKIAKAIAENVDQYEKKFGPITPPAPRENQL